MKINIPCPSCGCQYCTGETFSGEHVKIEICRCNDGSGEFDIAITAVESKEISYEKHQCSEKDIEECLASRFNVDINSMNHQCFN